MSDSDGCDGKGCVVGGDVGGIHEEAGSNGPTVGAGCKNWCHHCMGHMPLADA